MSATRRFVVLFLALVCCLEVASADGTLTLSADATEFLPLEPVYVQVRYDGDHTPLLNPAFGRTLLRICKAGEQECSKYVPTAHYDVRRKQKRDVSRKVSTILNLTVDRNGWVFGEPGNYYLTMVVRKSGLESNSLFIRVRNLASGEDKAVYKRLKGCAKYRAFVDLGGSERLPEVLKLVRNIAEKSCGYSASARMLMAHHFSQSSCTPQGKKRGIDIAQVMNYLDAVRGRRLLKARILALAARSLPSDERTDNAAERVLRSKLRHFSRGEGRRLGLRYFPLWARAAGTKVQ